MKKLIFLLILMIGFEKEIKAISTELFACPTAKVLKIENVLIGGRFFYFIPVIYTRIGILDFLETEGLVNLLNNTMYGSLKLVFLKEKENFPQIAFMLHRGRTVKEDDEYPYTLFGLIFSKKIHKNLQINASIFKGKALPVWIWVERVYHNEKYSFHTSLERNIDNLKLILELHNLPTRENILIGGVICKAKNFNFKLGHSFLKEKDEIEYIFPFLSIEYEIRNEGN